MESNSHRHIVRNVIIFTVVVIALSWLAWLVAVSDGTSESRDLGSLIFLVSPLIACVGLRLFGGDGWQDLGLKPNFKGNGVGYALAVLIHPVSVGVVVLIGALFGGITFDKGSVQSPFVVALLIQIVIGFVKNIFEEFGWRGYLTPKLNKLALPHVTVHLITGAIWGVWHLPYYLALLTPAQIAQYTSLNFVIFYIFVLLGLVAAGIAFGEIRLLTGSIWPAVLLHAMSNAFILTLLMDGYVRVSPATELLFTPGMHGILSIVIITTIGIGMYRWRAKEAT